ncbi:protein of unknown function (plasmid) [Rhodovastum atsumiense]|nr:protein of unknown function [Rhodovastum atsumiense]
MRICDELLKSSRAFPPGTPRLPLPPPAPAAAGRRSSAPLSAGHPPHRADGGQQLWYRLSWRIAPSGGSGRLVTRLDTPPHSGRRHPVSPIAPKPPLAHRTRDSRNRLLRSVTAGDPQLCPIGNGQSRDGQNSTVGGTDREQRHRLPPVRLDNQLLSRLPSSALISDKSWDISGVLILLGDL